MLDETRRRGWAVIVPNFRGPNNTPEACASDLAVQDVLDSVDFARKRAPIDNKRIYLLGSSGGGFMGLMMASRAPRLWAAISVWAPIANLAAWHIFSKASNSPYHKTMDERFGGPLKLRAGNRNTSAGRLYTSSQAQRELPSILTRASTTATREDITAMTKEARIPDRLAKEIADEPARKEKILFRRVAGPVTLTIFDGGRSVDIRTGIRYFE